MDGEFSERPLATTASAPKRWGLTRKVIMAVAVSLFLFGTNCLYDGWRHLVAVEHWRTATLMSGVVDFSREGRFEFPFEQGWTTAHGDIVTLKLPPAIVQGKNEEELLKGLEAEMQITPIGSTQSMAVSSAGVRGATDSITNEFEIFRFSTLPKGKYTASVTVKSGASALQGATQKLEAGYELCGLETLAGNVMCIIGGACALLGAIIGFIAYPDRP